MMVVRKSNTEPYYVYAIRGQCIIFVHFSNGQTVAGTYELENLLESSQVMSSSTLALTRVLSRRPWATAVPWCVRL